MSKRKKPNEGFLARLFKHKKVDELAEELSNTYADEIREDVFSESENLEDDSPVELLEVSDSGDIDFQNTDNSEDSSPPIQNDSNEENVTENNSNIRNHIITFRVNDAELAAIDKRCKETSFRSRGDFCRYSALTVMNVEQDDETLKGIAKFMSSVSNSFNQIAYRTNKNGRIYEEDIFEMKEYINIIWQLLTSIRSSRERTMQLLISATQTKPQTANMLLATCAYLLHKEHQSNLQKQESESAEVKQEQNVST